MKHSKETKEICEHPVWTKMFKSQLKFDSKSKANWSFEGSKNRTGLMAAPMGAGITGLDAGNTSEQDFSGALIIDDPIDATKARFANARKDCIRHYDEKLTTRRRTPTTPTILIQQRLHKEDLAGWVLATEPEDWDVLKIEALDEDGQSFWEERYPVVELNKIRTNNPEKFYSQYQQDPITIGGNVIKKEYFKFYQELPDFKYIFITGDTAQKTKEHNDWSVFVVWGVTDYGIYFLDMMRDKLEAPQLLERAKAFYKNWAVFQNKNCRAFYIEDKSSGTGLIQQLEQQTMIPVIGVPKHTDKLSDVEDCTPFMAAGKVFLPYNENHGHNPTVISECVSFTRDDSHAWDDIVDNFVIAIKQTLAGTPSILDVL